jgi:prepilin-type N-terminal cleavage/methylation domain-containing protein
MKRGFTLVETLLALGVLAIGCLCVAGSFCVGIHFSSVATEQTMAAIVADEAFAKVRIFAGQDPNWLNNLPPFCVDFNSTASIDPNEFFYPSTEGVPQDYYWQALCRKAGPHTYQITVFSCRKIGARPASWLTEIPTLPTPQPTILDVGNDFGTRLGDPAYIIEPLSGQLYIGNKIAGQEPRYISLADAWPDTALCWAIPSAAPRTTSPCIRVFQKIVCF